MSRLTLCTVVLALASSACGSNSPVAPTPLPDPIVDTYQGTLLKNDAERFSFVTAISGTLTARLTALNPTGMVVGLGLGVFNTSTGTCQVALSNERATLGAVIQGQSDRAGTLCVRIFDVGNVVDPVTYTIQVEHQ